MPIEGCDSFLVSLWFFPLERKEIYFAMRHSLPALHPLRVLPVLLALGLLLAACGGGGSTATSSTPTSATPTTSSTTLNVFAAASLTASFKTIATQYQAAHPTVKITYNFNGSQLLAQQIINGAKAEVFASADLANMKKVSDPGLVGTQSIFARNRLAVIIPASNPGHITSLKDLANKGVKIVVAAPSVPVGKYALQVLDKMGKSSEYGPAYESAVKANFVSEEENVTSVVNKVQLDEADGGRQQGHADRHSRPVQRHRPVSDRRGEEFHPGDAGTGICAVHSFI
jgi:molybdate transport system substrate-binding protein